MRVMAAMLEITVGALIYILALVVIKRVPCKCQIGVVRTLFAIIQLNYVHGFKNTFLQRSRLTGENARANLQYMTPHSMPVYTDLVSLERMHVQICST